MWLCFPEAGFDAIFDWLICMQSRFFYMNIAKSTPCDKICKRLGFFTLTFASHITFYMGFHIVALILSFEWRFRYSSHAMNSK